MSYTKTNWVNDQAPAINATNLNKIENGIFNNDAIITSIMTTLGINATTWVSTNTYVEGDSVVYNNKLYKNISGNYTTTNPAEDTTNWQETTLLDIQYPIGKTELFYDTLDHSNHLGFTWERTCVGRVPVGIDANDNDFNTIGETGGYKGLQKHTHQSIELGGNTMTSWSSSGSGGIFNLASLFQSNQPNNNQVNTGGVNGNATDGGAPASATNGNLQPYQVFAIWKRIS